MQTSLSEIKNYFGSVIGAHPWRVRTGWGSFLTFDFGQRVKNNSHYQGEWRLWIYQCEWELHVKNRVIANSESSKRLIDVVARRLERETLRDVEFDKKQSVTRFEFSRSTLVCRPYSDKNEPDDEYWLFFMPSNQVLIAGVERQLELVPAEEKQFKPALR